MNKNPLFSVLLVVLLALLPELCGCSNNTEGNGLENDTDSTLLDSDSLKADYIYTPNEDSLLMRVAVIPTHDALPLLVAQACGLVDSTRVHLAIDRQPSLLDALLRVAKGQSEACMTDKDLAAWAGKKFGIPLDTLMSTQRLWRLISNRNARLKKPAQMGDKMVAVVRNSALERLTDRIEKQLPKDRELFRIEVNALETRLQMLLNNEIDAAWLPEPQATKAVKAGHIQMLPAQTDSTAMSIIAVRTEWGRLSKSKEAMEAVRQAYKAAQDSIRKHPEAYQELMNF